MSSHITYPVAIIGAGPVGLSLALGLARRGVRVLVLEQKPELDPHSRATVIHCRTLEIFGQLKVLDPFLAQGERVTHVHLQLPSGERIVHFDFTELIDETETAFALALSQDKTERILLEEVVKTGLVDVLLGHKALRFETSDSQTQIIATGPDGEATFIARFLVGADGAHSSVREFLKLDLNGKTYPTRALLADVRVDANLDKKGIWPTLLNHAGFISAIRFGDRVWRIIEQSVDPMVNDDNIDDHVSSMTAELFGAAPVEIIWRNTYRKHERCAPTLRVGRVLLVGDAGHINSPAGGQGMNAGIQDAHNLAWKLAMVAKGNGADTEALLSSYSEERLSFVTRDIQPFTDIAERFQTAPPFARKAVVEVADLVFGFSKSASTMTRRLSMLNPEYRHSRLIESRERPVGFRVPDVLDGENGRLFPRLPQGGIVWAGDGTEATKLAQSLRVPCVQCDVASLRKFFNKDEFVALVRPDHIVGLSAAPSELPAMWSSFHRALGIVSDRV